MSELNPGQKLARANDDYHEAVEEMLLDENLPLKLKVKLGCEAGKVFAGMALVGDIIGTFYGVD